jgi:hypothetical protein
MCDAIFLGWFIPHLSLETMLQFAETVIPDERRFAGRDPESSESSM